MSYYKDLEDFITRRMRMSHIYQPVMLLELLQNKGAASVDAIAHALLSHDESQLEYYRHITNNMVGKVLTKNNGITVKDGKEYRLQRFNELNQQEIEALVALCESKIEQYVTKRGSAIWQHRTKSAGYISGTLRYEVLMRAKSRCELCGISNQEKALEVDHIVPRNHGGKDDISNLQSLCYSCNAMKRDRDDTDFRNISDHYKVRDNNCPFCTLTETRKVAENELAIALRDLYPVTQGHTLIIPKRHVADYFSLYQPERNCIEMLLQSQRAAILESDSSVTSFNIGINAGSDAGQTVFHCHVHLIPRRNGDCEDPRGGVRGVIPDKQQY
jgi:ATP adenylyltransferase